MNRSCRKSWLAALALCLLGIPGGQPAAAGEVVTPAEAQLLAAVDRLFADAALDQHLPGVVYGVVRAGELVHVRGIGVQDLEHRRAVDADTVFRIASMSKAFTALTVLQLRDQGRVRLEAPAEEYVPELRGWPDPTRDSPRIRVRDLLNHTAGLVTDDPWGDRQTPLPEEEFTALLRAGVPVSRPPGMAMEYSNMGYALLGRIIGNVSGQPYAAMIGATLLTPLDMRVSTYDINQVPDEHRALGYRWEDGAWRLEPTLQHGAFGAMGGLHTSARDYARWMTFLLDAWPPRDDEDTGPVRRATVREIAQGSNFPALQLPPPEPGETVGCPRAVTYGMGMRVVQDCELGLFLTHGGGYPGYGSNVLLLPDHGIGVFAFANRTYAGMSGVVYRAAVELKRRGYLPERASATGARLAAAYAAVGAMYAKGSVRAGGEVLAMNFLLDRDASGWKRELAQLREQVGDCATDAPLAPQGALAGEFEWRCAHGRVQGSLLLAPSNEPRIQWLSLQRVEP